MDLLTIGMLLEDTQLRARVRGACVLSGIEMTEDIVLRVVTRAASPDFSGTITDDDIRNAVAEYTVPTTEEDETDNG